ncbi:hypothetical protein OF83DRAFT_1036300, partial [Amylostereum chailletii]
GVCNLGKVLDEVTVEVSKPEEQLDILDIARGGPFSDARYLDRIHSNLVMQDNQAEVLNRILFKDTFLRLEEEVIVLQALQHLHHQFMVLFECLCEDKDVVHVDDNLATVNEIFEKFIHHCLECRRRIHKAKEHHQGFVQPTVSFESGLPLVSFLDMDILVVLDIVVAPADIYLGEDLGTLEFVDELGDEWEWVFVLDGAFVQRSVVLHGMELSILFLDKEEGTRHGQFRRTNVTLFDVFIKEAI